MKKTKFAIFMLLNLFWLIIVSGVIYTVYLMPIDGIILLGPGPIGKSFINFQFIMVMLLVMCSNVLFYKAKDESLNIARRILFYVTCLTPTLFIFLAWPISHVRSGFVEYIDIFGFFYFWTYSPTSWLIVFIIGTSCLFSFLNIYLKQKK